MSSFLKNISKSDAMLLLNGLPKLGPISLKKLLQEFENNPLEIINSNPSKLLSISGIGSAMVDSILNPENETWLKKEKKAIRERGVRFITKDEYPSLLREIHDPPVGLYIKGDLPDLPCVSVVGTRQPSLYGQRICREISGSLADAGFCVVSGLARGIDSIAHRAVLERKGKTIAFLGSGLDIIYPPENFQLYKDISSNGAVISEFPFKRKADRRSFPRRNRLVSGISSGVIVIESGASGGSLITAQLAADQGRLVFAVPGRVDQIESAGCNNLIREGAILIRNAGDVVDEIMVTLDNYFGTTLKIEDKSVSSIFSNDSSVRKSLSSKELEIYNMLKDGSILAIDQIVESLRYDFSEVSSALTMMEIKGLLSRRADARFELK